MAGKPDNPAMGPHTPEKTGTCHTDRQWKVEGAERKGKTAKRSTQNVPSSCYTNKLALQPNARVI